MAFFSSIRNRPVLGFLFYQHNPTCQKWSPEEQLRYLFGFESRHSVVCDLPRQTCATLDHTQDWQDKMYTSSTVENKSSIQMQTAPWSEKSRVQVTSNKANNEIVNLINKSTDYSTRIVLQAKIQIDSPICKLARAPYKEKSLVCHDE